MNNRDNIEELFNEAFSNWEPQVPDNIKAAIDDELFRDKRGFFDKFKYLFIAISVVLFSVATCIFTGENESSKNQMAKSATSTQNENHASANSPTPKTNQNDASDKEYLNKENNITESPTSYTEKTNSGITKVDNKSKNLDLPQNASDKNNFQKKNSSVKYKSSTSKTDVSKSESFIAKSEQFNSISSAGKETNSSITKTENDIRIKAETPSHKNKFDEPDKPMAEMAASAEKEKTGVNDSISTEIPVTEMGGSNTSNPEPSFTKGFLIGATSGLHQGKNKFSSNDIGFEENRNWSFGLDLSYRFKPKSMLSTGFMYQQRRESFSQSVQQVDSVFLFSEPITETFIDNVTNDTITVIIGYYDVYDYDTTQIAVSTDAVVRLMLLPLAYNFQVFGWKNHEFWLGTGVNLGLYRVSGSIQQTNQTWAQNQFAMQVFLRPSYQLAFGKWRAGVYGNFVYDAVLPQTWSMNRRRWQLGGGFQISYRISKSQQD